MTRHLTLILGGARSGKSTYAERLAADLQCPVIYIATATAGDAEMQERIANHRASRPADWATLEAPAQVGRAVAQSPLSADVYLLDCVTLWASNVIINLPEPHSVRQAQAAMDAELDDLLAQIEQRGGEWILVSNEVGLGLVPAYELGRLYRDTLGRANQRLAAAADRVIFMVAGLPMQVKPGGLA